MQVSKISKTCEKKIWYFKPNKLYSKTINQLSNVSEFEVNLANIGRVFASSGSLEQAGGDRWWVFLDDLPEAGGVIGGSWIRSLALFPQCQVELLSCPAEKEGGGVSDMTNTAL